MFCITWPGPSSRRSTQDPARNRVVRGRCAKKYREKKIDIGILHTTKLVYLGYKHENFCRFQTMLLRVLRYMTYRFGHTIYNLYVFYTCVSHIPHTSGYVFLHTWGEGGAHNSLVFLKFFCVIYLR